MNYHPRWSLDTHDRSPVVRLPTLHPGQVAAFRVFQRNRYTAVVCGRRWGKTDLGKTIASDYVVKGRRVGWFAPDYRTSSEAFNEIVDTLSPIVSSSSKVGRTIRTTTGGLLEFWTLDNNRAGRSRKYHLALVDEAGFTKDGDETTGMIGVWNKAIRPTLLDYGGKGLVMSNTNGINPENFLWQICHQPEHHFVMYQAPTHTNPYLPADEVARLERDNHPLVYAQEYLAQFVDWSGVAFFGEDNMLVDGKPVEWPKHCDCVFAIVDTATKTGKENDGTGVTYFAYTKQAKYPLIILDYDYMQIQGALLEIWLNNVFVNLEALAKQCGARAGSVGAHIEDKSSGMVLLQHCANKQLPGYPISSKLTELGKVERSISVSGYVWRGLVKYSQPAFDRILTYKNVTKNHLKGQIHGFRVNDKDPKDDDLLDTFTYGVALSCGNSRGF